MVPTAAANMDFATIGQKGGRDDVIRKNVDVAKEQRQKKTGVSSFDSVEAEDPFTQLDRELSLSQRPENPKVTAGSGGHETGNQTRRRVM